MHSGCIGVSVCGSQQATGRRGVGLEIASLQCILVAAAEPEVALLSHILSQVQRGEVKSIIAGLGNEHLAAVKLPGIVAGDAKHTVDGILRVVTVQVWPEDGAPSPGIPEEGRVEQRAHIGQRVVVRIQIEDLVKGAAKDGLGLELEVLPAARGFLGRDLEFM